MKGLFWNKLNLTSVSETIWEKMNNSINIPKELLETEFAQIDNDNSKKLTATTTESKTTIVLDHKRWQNISIMLSKFKLKSFQDIKTSIRNMDEDMLSLDDIYSLSNFVPNSNEIERLKPYKDECAPKLGDPEQFFLVIMDIPDLDTRLECWQFKLSFSQKYSDILQRHEELLAACREIKSSKKFATILEVVLCVGNFLNYNSNRGGAWGYRLDSLLRLGDIKSRTDSDKSLLHIVFEILQVDSPEVIDFYHDFRNIDRAKEIQQINSLLGDIQSLENSIQKTENFLSSPPGQYGSFTECISPFVPYSKEKVQKLRVIHKTASDTYVDLLNYLGEPKTTPVGAFFSTLQGFITAFEKTKFAIARKAVAKKPRGLPSIPSQGTLNKVIAGLKSGDSLVI
eukprot:TRINITY_DN4673_c0_g2_i1.p1 TRINITY_DN4673_c0_g2~~TRINITY_DN4673_c0_g2_i1.p1  ORF type:complete len:398 (+),score=59.05 TRINITY_DN4673_c0_g2_i1:89-1282(+)